MATNSENIPHTSDGEWVAFRGGELEGRRPRRQCPACLNKPTPTPGQPLCFQCYRLELDRERALKAAATLNTASEARFQFTLPWEPVNTSRLASLKATRAADRTSRQTGADRFADRRRRAQIAARHALQTIAAELTRRSVSAELRERILAWAAHAAELQLPESWLPFVVGR